MKIAIFIWILLRNREKWCRNIWNIIKIRKMASIFYNSTDFNFWHFILLLLQFQRDLLFYLSQNFVRLKLFLQNGMNFSYNKLLKKCKLANLFRIANEKKKKQMSIFWWTIALLQRLLNFLFFLWFFKIRNSVFFIVFNGFILINFNKFEIRSIPKWHYTLFLT